MLIIINDNNGQRVSPRGLRAFAYDPCHRKADPITIMIGSEISKFQPHTIWQLEHLPTPYQCGYPTTNIPSVTSAHRKGRESLGTISPRPIAESGLNHATFVSMPLRSPLNITNGPTLRHTSLEGYAWVLYEILEQLAVSIMSVRMGSVGWWVQLSKF